MDAMPCRYSHVDAFVPSMAPTGGNIIPGIPRFTFPKLPFMGAGKKGSGKEASKAEAAKNSNDPELRQVGVCGGGLSPCMHALPARSCCPLRVDVARLHYFGTRSVVDGTTASSNPPKQCAHVSAAADPVQHQWLLPARRR